MLKIYIFCVFDLFWSSFHSNKLTVFVAFAEDVNPNAKLIPQELKGKNKHLFPKDEKADEAGQKQPKAQGSAHYDNILQRLDGKQTAWKHNGQWGTGKSGRGSSRNQGRGKTLGGSWNTSKTESLNKTKTRDTKYTDPDSFTLIKVN